MNNYVDYEFYAESYHGKLGGDDFEKAVIKATAYVRRFTFGRADGCSDDEDVKLATCAVCDVIVEDESFRKKHQGRNITSENNDGYSVSFVQEQNAGETAEEMLNRKAYKAAEVFLSPTGLLDWGL